MRAVGLTQGGSVRSMLHVPHTRKRSLAAATLGALALIGSLLVATPAQALNDTGTGGVFISSTGRILDTAKGTGGFSTPMEAGKYRTIKVAGLAGLPDDGSVGAVSLNATVGASTGNGTLFGRPDADTGRTTMLIYNGVSGEYTSNTATVAVGADGTIQVMTETASRLILDVQGYYTANTDGTAAGGFVPVAKRIVDTRSGLGAAKAALAPGKSVDVQITGANGIPAGASGVVVNLIAINGTDADGYFTPYATGATKPANSLHYAPSESTSVQAQVPLSADGKITIANSSTTVNLLVDLQGYFAAAGKGGAVFTPAFGRAYDSRATGNTALAENETRSIQIAGTAGVPVMGSGVTAVVLTLIVAHGGGNGYADAWADGTTKPNTSAINFQTNEIQTNTITVPLGANGKISLRNAAKATNYVVDVQGWYANPLDPTITCDAPYAAGSWNDVVPASVSCTATAGPASGSDQVLSIDYGQEGENVTALSATKSTSVSFTMAPSGGIDSIVAAVFQGGDVIGQSEYGFGVGNWSTDSLTTFPADGEHVAGDLGLLVAVDGQSSFLENTAYSYTISSTPDMQTPVWSATTNDSVAAIPAGTLSDLTTYYWQASVAGPTDWAGSMATKQTEIASFVPDAGSGEVVTPMPEGQTFTTFSKSDDAKWYTTKVVSRSLINSNKTKWSIDLGGCRGAKGSTCNVAVGGSAGVDIQTSFGMSKGAIAADIGISSNHTESYSVGETSPPLPNGKTVYHCSPMGKYYQYKIRQTTHWTYKPKKSATSDSGWKYTWDPTKRIDCKFD